MTTAVTFENGHRKSFVSLEFSVNDDDVVKKMKRILNTFADCGEEVVGKMILMMTINCD